MFRFSMYIGNLFIAGTSCKDFSMLKSKDRKGKLTTDSFYCLPIFLDSSLLNKSIRLNNMFLLFVSYIDIEDKGTSGETFLAAVEYLDEKQPATAIFENVKNAPWDKVRFCLSLFQKNCSYKESLR